MSSKNTPRARKAASPSRVTVDRQALLIPTSLLMLGALRVVFGAPLWLLATLCLWIPLYYIAYPALSRRKWAHFERAFSRHFQRGEHKQLLELYERQWFLKRFGPKAELWAKLALIYSALERYREAEEALERALDATPSAQRERLYFNHANIKFELGKYDDAEAIYRTLKPASPYRHASQAQLALIGVYRGGSGDEVKTRRELERALPRASGALKQRIEEALAAS